MSQVVVIAPPPLRKFVNGKTHIPVEGATVRQALEAFAASSESLRTYIFDEDEKLRRFVRVFVDGKPATMRPGREEPVDDGAQVTILLALAGG